MIEDTLAPLKRAVRDNPRDFDARFALVNRLRGSEMNDEALRYAREPLLANVNDTDAREAIKKHWPLAWTGLVRVQDQPNGPRVVTHEPGTPAFHYDLERTERQFSPHAISAAVDRDKLYILRMAHTRQVSLQESTPSGFHYLPPDERMIDLFTTQNGELGCLRAEPNSDLAIYDQSKINPIARSPYDYEQNEMRTLAPAGPLIHTARDLGDSYLQMRLIQGQDFQLIFNSKKDGTVTHTPGIHTLEWTEDGTAHTYHAGYRFFCRHQPNHRTFHREHEVDSIINRFTVPQSSRWSAANTLNYAAQYSDLARSKLVLEVPITVLDTLRALRGA